MIKPKKTAALIAAEQIAANKAEELAAVRSAVLRIEGELRQANDNVRKAQEDADSSLPQCRMVRVRWRSGKEEDYARVVILRKTPSGILVVRRVGEAGGPEYKFKPRKFDGVFSQTEKQSSFDDCWQLRDVPDAFVAKGGE